MNESINGYVLLKPFTNAGDGQSRWSVALYADNEYFIKEFLAPTYPVPGAPGSTETKRRKLLRCQAFETHQWEMADALMALDDPESSLLITRSFFRSGSKYYRVVDKVDDSLLPPEDIAAMSRDRQLAIALAVTQSVNVLHRANIVHGDLRPSKFLLKRRGDGGFSTRLIDFDNAFFAGCPPPPDVLAGDADYLSPELLEYLTGKGSGERVLLASDIFALGVMFLLYFGADVPVRTGDGGRPLFLSEQAQRDGRLETGLDVVWPAAAALVSRMTDADPNVRPTATEIVGALENLIAEHENRLDNPGPSWFAAHATPGSLRWWNGRRWTSRTWRRAEGVFVSYARSDQAAVKELVSVLRTATVPVWLDEELHGGDPWWDEILNQIEKAAVFIIAVSDQSRTSRPCKYELAYAEKIGIPVLPVLVGPVASLRTSTLAQRQFIDYRSPTIHGTARLLAAIFELRQRRGPKLEPMPNPPTAPFEYLLRIPTDLANEELPRVDQRRILEELTEQLDVERDAGVREEICGLLLELADHRDAVRSTIAGVQALLTAERGQIDALPTASGGTPISKPSQP